MSKSSKTMWHGIPIVITEKSGIRWGKKPSAYNRCVGGELRGAKGGGTRGVIERFKAAVSQCKRH